MIVALFFTLSNSAHAAPGDADPRFARDGFAMASLGNKNVGARSVAVVLDSQGRPVVLAETVRVTGCIILSCSTEERSALVRFTADGVPDPEFAGDGELEPAGLPSSGDWSEAHFEDLALQPDGRIVLVGSTGRLAIVARLLPDGSPDPSFGGGDGAVRPDLVPEQSDENERLTAVEIMPEGLVAAGKAGARVLLARLTAEGALDASFGEAGIVTVHPDAFWPPTLSVTDTRLLLGVPGARAVYAYRVDGTPDEGFGDGGKVPVEGSNVEIFDVASDPDGRVLVLHSGESPDGEVELIRLAADGARDFAFGSDGTIETGGTYCVTCDDLTSLSVDPAGRPLVVGGDGSTIVRRFTESGAPDRSFGREGNSSVWVRRKWSSVNDVALGGDAVYLVGATDRRAMVARRELAEGPDDLDGDTRLDGAELCPHIFGRCPRLPRQFTRLTYGRLMDQGEPYGRNAIRGWVISRDGNCESGPASLFRKRPGRDRRIAHSSDTHYVGGGIQAEGRFTRGRYYAVAPKLQLRYGNCPAVRSPTLDLNDSPGRSRVRPVRRWACSGSSASRLYEEGLRVK